MLNRITTGLFRPVKRKKPKYLTTMICLECGHLFEASRTDRPCPGCGDAATFPASKWAPAKYGMPKFKTGRVGKDESIHNRPV